MYYNPNLHNRYSIRLQGYDYTQPGAYFSTINTHNKIHNLGQIINGTVQLFGAGIIAQELWLKTPRHFNNVILGEFVIMPNHMHAIVVIADGNKSQRISPVEAQAGEIILIFPSISCISPDSTLHLL